MATFSDFILPLQTENNDGKAFERFCKWFLAHDPEWSTQVDHVWLWDEWPDRWGRDCGIDLIFRHKNGEIWAVQCKCYSETNRITKQDMDTFLSESSRPLIHKRLLMASTDLLSPNAIRTSEAQEKPVVRYMLKDFEAAEVKYPSDISLKGGLKPREKPTPREHQIEAISAIKDGLKDNDRGQLIMACGTGKTLTTLWAKEELEANDTLVLLPSLGLLAQTLKEWTSGANAPFDVLCVCSDSTVGRRTEEEDLRVSEAPFPVTSETGEIERFLNTDGPKVVFCTYQSSDLIAEVQEKDYLPAFDLVVCDEAHRCAGKPDARFATILDSGTIRAKKRLFTTATPRAFTSSLKNRAEERGVEIVGMDDVETFGPELHRLTFGEAIGRDLLTDYQVVIVGVDEPTVKRFIDERKLVSLHPDHTMSARTLAAQIGLLKAIKDYNLRRVISFHSRVDRAKGFSSELSNVLDFIGEEHSPKGSLWSEYISGKMNAGERTLKIRKLKELGSDDRGLLANARCLSEGIDVPALDGVAFIDPRGSQVDIIQAVGRAIRKNDQKELGTIVIPVFIEDGDDAESIIEASNFKTVWDVLKALRAHDDVLAESLDQYRTNMAKSFDTMNHKISDKVILDIPSGMGEEFPAALRSVIVEYVTSSWEFAYGILQVFYMREGHCLVPSLHVERNFRLGQWVSVQRRFKDSLNQKRKDRLEKLGFIWNTIDAKWDDNINALKRFSKLHGHCAVPKNFKEGQNDLGNWVSKVRSKKETLSEIRIEQLNDLKFVWEVRRSKEDEAWENGYSHLEKFFLREGHSRTPASHIEEGFRLGGWVLTQRHHARNYSAERTRRLDELEFQWEPFASEWGSAFDLMIQFHKREGHSHVPVAHKEEGFRLGGWVNVQRTSYHRNRLPQDKIDKLNSINFVWDAVEEQWRNGFNALRDFLKREGHCFVPEAHLEGKFPLGSWVKSQRRSLKSKNNPKLTSQRIELLNSVGFSWSPTDDRWRTALNILKLFKKREGHCLVPKSHIEQNFKLGQWVLSQRSQEKKGRLPDWKREELRDVDFVWGIEL